jgi:hypothetical protein
MDNIEYIARKIGAGETEFFGKLQEMGDTSRVGSRQSRDCG